MTFPEAIRLPGESIFFRIGRKPQDQAKILEEEAILRIQREAAIVERTDAVDIFRENVLTCFGISGTEATKNPIVLNHTMQDNEFGNISVEVFSDFPADSMMKLTYTSPSLGQDRVLHVGPLGFAWYEKGNGALNRPTQSDWEEIARLNDVFYLNPQGVASYEVQQAA